MSIILSSILKWQRLITQEYNLMLLRILLLFVTSKFITCFNEGFPSEMGIPSQVLID